MICTCRKTIVCLYLKYADDKIDERDNILARGVVNTPSQIMIKNLLAM